MLYTTLFLLLISALCTAESLYTRHYLVELDDTATTDEFLSTLSKDQVQVHRVIAHKFLKAISIEIKENEWKTLENLKENPDVTLISPIQRLHRADFAPPEVLAAKNKVNNLTCEQVELISPHRLSQVKQVHNQLQTSGRGILIGVIDSGVDYMHPALGGGFGKGYKVAVGYDLVGNKWNSSDPNSPLEPDDDPLDDCGKDSNATGHGTHVSGIIAGDDKSNGFKGVAYNATLGMWRVFSCQGSTRSDVVIHALLMAYDAGADIISLSLGSGAPFSAPQDIQSRIISKITNSGVSVVMSAGNNGAKGAFTTGAPGNSIDAFEVASVNNEYYMVDGTFNATGIDTLIGYNFVEGADFDMIDGTLTLTNKNSIDPFTDACMRESVSPDVEGKIVLVKRGGCNFTVKVNNIAEKGGIAAIIYNNINEATNRIVAKGVTIPVSYIWLQDGVKLVQLLRGNNVMASFNKKGPGFLKSPYATTVSSFSSTGPTAELNLKPNIAAVGQLIYSTLPRYMGSWGFKDGTSMACPYVAGSIALYLQYHGKNDTARHIVHEKFQNYAYLGSVENRTSGFIDSPVRQGAGSVQVYDTILQRIHVSPAHISFNDTCNMDYKTQSLTITNDGAEAVSYRVINNVSVSLSPYNRTGTGFQFVQPENTIFDRAFTANALFSLDQINLKPGESQKVEMTIQPPSTNPLDHITYGGYIQFDPISTSAKPIHVPYFGIVGNQREIPIFDPQFNITIQNNATDIIYKLHKSINYDFTSEEAQEAIDDGKHMSLLIKYRLLSPTMIIQCHVIGSDNVTLGHAFPPLTYNERNFINGTKKLVWNGQYIPKIPYDVLGYSEENVPQVPQDQFVDVKTGMYQLKVSALKIFGVDDWEEFIVGPIHVRRKDNNW